MQKLPSLVTGGSSIECLLDEIEPCPHCHDCCQSFPNPGYPCSADCKELSSLLKHTIEFLDTRRQSVFNDSEEFKDLTNFVTQRRQEWINTDHDDGGSSIIADYADDTGGETHLESIYILRCPEMHCVSGNVLRRWIAYNAKVKKGLDVSRYAQATCNATDIISNWSKRLISLRPMSSVVAVPRITGTPKRQSQR